MNINIGRRPVVLMTGLVLGVAFLALILWSWNYTLNSVMELWYRTMVPRTLPRSVSSWLGNSPGISYIRLSVASVGWLLVPVCVYGGLRMIGSRPNTVYLSVHDRWNSIRWSWGIRVLGSLYSVVGHLSFDDARVRAMASGRKKFKEKF